MGHVLWAVIDAIISESDGFLSQAYDPILKHKQESGRVAFQSHPDLNVAGVFYHCRLIILNNSVLNLH